VRKLLGRAAFYAALSVISVALAFIFIAYFVPPRDLAARLFALDLHTAGGIAGATVTLITFLDFTLVRQRFCTSVCPYGYLQGLLGDDNTLLVAYKDEGHECIECKKCVRMCHMGIDIRESPYQIQCVHCGECIDACVDVLGKLGKQGLIQYTWGESGAAAGAETSWFRKLRFRDAKRVVLLLVLAFYASGLFVALGMRRSLLVQLMAERATLYRMDDSGVVYNRFRLKVANRSGSAESVVLSVEGLPGARLTLAPNPLTLAAGEAKEIQFDVAATRFAGAQDVNHFRVIAHAAPAGERESFDETFLIPAEGSTK
jgi:cytochrome c oxidase accessory protein FixG